MNEDQETEINIVSSPLRIPLKEVETICKSLKNGKSLGPGDIPAELIKAGTHKLFNLGSYLRTV